jgi:hypothetical protein
MVNFFLKKSRQMLWCHYSYLVHNPDLEGSKCQEKSSFHLASRDLNPILHTAWLESHALTLKNNTAKYYLGEKSSFVHT